MRRKKFKGLNRILSMMLVFVMGFTLICATILADDETTDGETTAEESADEETQSTSLTITFQDESGNTLTDITNIEITLTEVVQGRTAPNYSAATKTVTVVEGVAVISDDEFDSSKTYELDLTNLIGYEASGTVTVNFSNDSSVFVTLTAIETVTISGTFTDENGDGVSNVEVTAKGYTYVYTTTASDDESTEADEAGTWSLTIYSGQEYTLSFSGYDTDKYQSVPSIELDSETDYTEEGAFDVSLVLNTFKVSASVSESTGGSVSITVDGTEYDPGTSFNYGTSVKITVSADTTNSYTIKEITVDGDSLEDSSISGATSYEYTIESLTADTEIVAYFYQQTYTITVGIGTNGSVKYYYPSTSESGSEFEDNVAVDFGKNSTVKVVATPNSGYHVSKVTIDGDPQTDVDTSNDSTYTKEITITADTIITVTFEINTYTLTVEETGGDVSGSVTVDGSEYSGALTYDHGSSATLEITPPSGYNVSVTINDEDITLEYDYNNLCFTYTISSISEDTAVSISYSEYGSLAASDVLTYETYSNTGTDSDENTIYYYQSSATISVSDSYKSTYKILQSDGSYETTYIVSSTTDSTLTLTLFDGEWWYTVDTDIIFVIDGTAPEIKITSTSAERGITTVKGTVSDSGSGVASLYYTYTEKGQTKTVNVEFDSDGNFTITYKGDQHTTYTLYATDNAGNTTDGEDLDVLIDTVAPVIEITSTYDGSWTNEDVTIEGTVDDGDDGSGIASLYYTYTDEDGETVTVSVDITYKTSTSGFGRDQTTTTSTTSGSFSITFENEQNITYTLYAEDESGNVTVLESSEENGDAEDEESEENKSEEEEDTTSCCVTFTIKIDKTSPYLTAETSTSDWHNGSVTISGVVSDAYTVSDGETVSNSVYSDIAEIYYKDANGKKVSDIEYDPETGKYAVTLTTEQDTAYSVYAVDDAGNETEITDLTVKIDTTAPTIDDFEITKTENSTVENIINFLTFGTFFNKEVEITVSVSDDNSGASYVVIYYGDTDEDGNTVYTALSGKLEVEGGTVSYTTASAYFDKVLYAVVTDAAGNSSDYTSPTSIDGEKTIQSDELMIEEDAPEISITPDDCEYKDSSDEEWYDGDVGFEIVITDPLYDEDDESSYSGISSIKITINGEEISEDTSGNEITTNYSSSKTREITYTVSTEGINADSDGSYVIEVTAMDNAGNETSGSYTVYVDEAAPEVVTFEFENEGGEPVENTGEDYEYFFGEDITVTITAKDESPSSGINSITYYLVDVYDGTTDTVTASVDEDGQISFELSADFKGYIYAKATDNVRNTGEYVSPSGTVLETEDMHSDTASIVFDYDDPNSNGYYDDDVEVIVTVSDTYSGIASIEWSVTSADPSNDQSGTESGFTTVSKDENLITSMSKTITVSSNSNDIVLKVTLTDNAGNTTTKSITLDIDKTNPEISVSYSNNNAENGTYFDANRTATITITERNLDTSDVVITVTKDGSSYSVGSLKWTKKSGSGNGDGTTWTAKITYSSDGDYTFSISAKDLAGNKNGSVSYGSSVAPTSFTIDKTAPVISVSYSNNNASNGTYFNASRTATITITEHNFDPSLVEITVTASLDGSTISTPAVSSWSTSGNTHTATIVYSADGDYTFDISMTDLAGNANSGVSYGSSVAYDSFTIDTTLYTDDGTGIITGVEDGAAYSGDVIPGVYFNDINYDEGSVVITLTRTRKGEIDEDVTDEFITGNYTETSSGVSAVFDVFDKTKDNDGIYTLYVSYLDLAGNFVSQSVTFTINRYGSVYVYSDDLANLISDGGAYVQSVSGLSLIITEYNPDKLVENSLSIEITLDGKPLENVIYTVTPVINDEVEIGESGWYQYEYVLSEENFTSDGVYKITISSTDETGNNSENTNEEIYDEIIFRIDTTAPEITSITGLEKSIINAKTQEVTFTVYDTIGLYQIVVTVTDADGDVILTYTISGDDFNGDINNYTGTFLLTESGLAQTITIEVTDMAGNVVKTSDESFDPAYTVYTTVTLSTNFFVRWYANTFLFWFSVAAIVIIIGLIIFFILFKKRKKEDEEEAGTTAAQE